MDLVWVHYRVDERSTESEGKYEGHRVLCWTVRNLSTAGTLQACS